MSSGFITISHEPLIKVPYVVDMSHLILTALLSYNHVMTLKERMLINVLSNN